MLDLDALIDEAVFFGELSVGVDKDWLITSRGADPRLVGMLATHKEASWRRPNWTHEEDEFVRKHHMWLTDEQMAKELGRTINGVEIRRERKLGLYGVTKNEEWLTATTVSKLLGVKCTKSISRLIRLGILPGRIGPADRLIYLVERKALVRWAVNSENWLYFKQHNVTDPHIKRLITAQKRRWGDEWWSVGQAAAYHGVGLNCINANIQRGKLKATQWGNWWLKRSEVTRSDLKFFPNKGTYESIAWTSDGDAFLVLMRAIGLSYSVIGKLMNWTHQRVNFRWEHLRKTGKLDDVIKGHALPVQRRDDLLYADWRLCRQRLPFLVRAVDRFTSGQACTDDDLRLIVMVMRVAGQWHARADEQRVLAASWTFFSVVTQKNVNKVWTTLRDWGVDPLEMLPRP